MSVIYHAHVYFLPEQISAAEQLHSLLRASLSEDCWMGDLIHREVGPHTRPMFEINFAESLLPKVRTLLDMHRGELPVLIHPELADDVEAHTHGASWLGEELALKIHTLTRG
ncbi:DOPA 4,5-dioxygenase family protein [Iodobacter fluviatilis]|uniref:Aromatic ring-cleaving dioxygenase n=1 Tax=Iodobacter fluviatilis TaxID=537 RepID=A0A377SUJ2_9NEIS|nr:DOPA 4,5-dioxygenase family protein [Iodobacter fluviatilis]TCU88191.1 DOPA 4,5-dioxygenase [Iodobacter fluviatilis]STR45692.1 Aromatic ring-cleaving dioxygenase [Iodobacter fluviatilis]